VQTVVALLLAVLMQRLSRSTLLRSLVLTPYLVSNGVAAPVFLWILDVQLGVGNQVLTWLGMDRMGSFTSQMWAIPRSSAQMTARCSWGRPAWSSRPAQQV